MSNFTDSRIIVLSSDTADFSNTPLNSQCVYDMPGLLSDDNTIIYSEISIQSAQIPISFYIVNINNNTLKFKLGNGSVQTVTFDEGNYNANTFITEFTSKTSINVSLNKITGKYSFSSSTSFIFYSNGSTCFKLLGFDLNTDVSSSSNKYTSPYPGQFQGITRIKVTSSTLSTYSMDSSTGGYSNVIATIPVNSGAYGILLSDNSTQFKAILRPTNISNFDINLLDNDDNLIDFNNVPWHITLQLNITRKLEIADTSFPQASNLIPSDQTVDDNNTTQLEDIPYDPQTDLDLLLYQNGIYQ